MIVAESVANMNNVGSGRWNKVRGAPPRLSDVVWPATGAFVAMAIMGMADRMIAVKGLTLTIAHFALGVITLALFSSGWIARSVSVVAYVAFMIYIVSFHLVCLYSSLMCPYFNTCNGGTPYFQEL
eukprot:Gb_07600 [translate_table: standard]